MSPGDHKTHGEGQKVTLGKDAPVTREGAGYVPSESLAAESVKQGGEFAANRDAQPDATDSERRVSSRNTKIQTGDQASDSKGKFVPAREGQGNTAPSYATTQQHRDQHGPHGKNISEGFEDSPQLKDGLKAALNAEPGSINDPSRLAEQSFQKKAAGKGTGPRDEKVGGGGAFEALSRDESA